MFRSKKCLAARVSLLALTAASMLFLQPLVLTGQSGDLENFLPGPALTGPWIPDGSPKMYRGADLFEYINGGAEIFHEYGFIRLIAQNYILGEQSVTIEVYEMEHPKAAFGIYSVQRDPEMPALDAGDRGTNAENMVSFCQDRFYALIHTGAPDGAAGEILARMAHDVSQRINRHSQLPDLAGTLPRRYLVPGSEGYVGGLLGLNTQLYLGNSNILGLNGRTVEGVFAQYRTAGNEAELLVIRYPDSDAADAAHDAVAKLFREKYRPLQGQDSVFTDSRNGYYCPLTVGNLLYIVNRSNSLTFVQQMESSIRPVHK